MSFDPGHRYLLLQRLLNVRLTRRTYKCHPRKRTDASNHSAGIRSACGNILVAQVLFSITEAGGSFYLGSRWNRKGWCAYLFRMEGDVDVFATKKRRTRKTPSLNLDFAASLVYVHTRDLFRCKSCLYATKRFNPNRCLIAVKTSHLSTMGS